MVRGNGGGGGGGSSFEAKAAYKDRHKSRGLFEDATQYAACLLDRLGLRLVSFVSVFLHIRCHG